MSLIRTNFPALSLFNDFLNSEGYRTAASEQNWVPAVNVIENDKNYEIEVAAPGLKKDQFNITVENGLLTVSGNTTSEEETKEKNYTRKEFTTKSFSRSFTLPENIDEESIKAKYEDGIM
ncbi:MAG TPA: molecular chaperone Hsp20, partial [Maribacter sp.]|nr:molecular chaperone Hsp20 [Maribacter sp.]